MFQRKLIIIYTKIIRNLRIYNFNKQKKIQNSTCLEVKATNVKTKTKEQLFVTVITAFSNTTFIAFFVN